jgi:hypothetical protein
VAGCDIILDAQLVANCLVLYVSARETHKLQLIMAPLVSNDIDEVSGKVSDFVDSLFDRIHFSLNVGKFSIKLRLTKIYLTITQGQNSRIYWH